MNSCSSIDAETVVGVTGITIKLTNDDATKLSRALHAASRSEWNKRKWPWLTDFIDTLDTERGVGGKFVLVRNERS